MSNFNLLPYSIADYLPPLVIPDRATVFDKLLAVFIWAVKSLVFVQTSNSVLRMPLHWRQKFISVINWRAKADKVRANKERKRTNIGLP